MTTPVPIGKLLKEYLDELDEKTLKEFQWYLIQIEIEGSRPIPKSKLENATIAETVNKLVEAFGEDGAVARTVDTFFRMNLNDLAYKLIQAKEDQSREQKEDEPEISSAREKPREVDPPVPRGLSCFFTDPVMLQCGHSSRRSRVHKDWERNIVRKCSLCKKVIPEGDPLINFSLKSLCENCRGKSQGEPSGRHRNHTESFQTPPENIRKKQKKVRQLCDSSIERIKIQSFNTKKKITDVFKKLHAFLLEEENTRQAALREEASLMIRMIHQIGDMTEKTYPLSDIMTAIAKMEADKIFLEDFKPEKKGMRRALRKLQMITKAEINVSEHVQNLPLKVWKKMWNDIKQTGADDGDEDEDEDEDENKDLSRLSAFDFRSEEKFNDTWQSCPGNPERSPHYQQNLQKSPKRRRVEQDYEDGKGSFLDPDHNTPILTHEGTFTQSPVFNDDDSNL